MRRAAPLAAYGLNGSAASIGARRVSVGAVLPRRKACGCLRRSRALCTALLLLGVARGRAADLEPPHPAQQDLTDMSVEQLIELKVSTVYGASKHWQEVAQAPSAVSILTAEEIKLHGYRTLADLLRSVRGLYVSYDRNYSYLGIRGFNRPGDYNTRTLLLIDGHRINDNIQDGALVGNEFLLDVDLIDRVEIIRGPGSSIYGNNAFFGVINIITKTGGAIDGAEVSGEAGSFQTYKGQFTYGKTLNNGLTMLFSGSYFDSQGPGKLFYKEYDAPESNNGVARHVDDEAFYSAFGTLSWSGFTLAGGYRSREKGIPTGSFDTVFNSRRNRTIDTRGYADLSYQQR